MASTGNTNLYKGIPSSKDAFIVLVKTEWNAVIVDKLEKGCKKICKENNIKTITLTVPGAVEISFIIQQHYQYAKQQPDAYIALGAIIQGGTPHFDYVCQMVANGISQLNLILDVPVVFGILTVNNQQQALDRVGGSEGNKGEEAAITALKMIALKASFVHGK